MLTAPVECSPGVWQLRLPLPFELNHVNTYLVKRDDGWMLVDTGLATAASYDELTAQMRALQVKMEEIRVIFLTHTHPDHVGQAKRLHEESGAEIWLQREELEQVTRIANSGDKPLWLDRVLLKAGVPGELVERIEGSFEKIRRNFQILQVGRVLEGGERIASGIGELELVLTPGHSPGHLCLYQRERRLLLAGDHVLERITPNIGWLPERDALGEFYESLERIGGYEVERILPGHGAVFGDLEKYVWETRGHHDERCAQIVGVLNGMGRCAHELVGEIWNRPLAPFHHRFAVFEVLAHLEFLERRGQVRSEEREGVQYWITD